MTMKKCIKKSKSELFTDIDFRNRFGIDELIIKFVIVPLMIFYLPKMHMRAIFFTDIYKWESTCELLRVDPVLSLL